MAAMEVISLQSGSNGNCVYVDTGAVRLLIDAGISGSQVQQRLAGHQVDVGSIDALLISHDHADHTRCMGIYQRKFGVPIYVTRPTYGVARRRNRLGTVDDLRFFESGAVLRFDSIVVETIRTPHDGIDGVAFVIDDGRRRLGVLTDLGHVFPGLDATINSLDAVLLESNYDPDMLDRGPYTESLKQRIRGPGGHLSNVEAAVLLNGAARGRLRWALLAHLSEHNNCPQVALETHRKIVGDQLNLHVADRYHATEMFHI
jgi:phosphoribosyl 1,2-cyclic phosphodiesterase